MEKGYTKEAALQLWKDKQTEESIKKLKAELTDMRKKSWRYYRLQKTKLDRVGTRIAALSKMKREPPPQKLDKPDEAGPVEQ